MTPNAGPVSAQNANVNKTVVRNSVSSLSGGRKSCFDNIIYPGAGNPVSIPSQMEINFQMLLIAIALSDPRKLFNFRVLIESNESYRRPLVTEKHHWHSPSRPSRS